MKMTLMEFGRLIRMEITKFASHNAIRGFEHQQQHDPRC